MRGARHTLMLPPPEECYVHSPTWVRGRGSSYFDAEPVSLVMALEEAPGAHHVSMVAAHLEVLVGWCEIADDVIATRLLDAPERRGVGFALLMFGAELASALGDERFGPRVAVEERLAAYEAISWATLRSAACLSATVSEYLVSVA